MDLSQLKLLVSGYTHNIKSHIPDDIKALFIAFIKIDLVNELNDHWWKNAKSAMRWKPRYECMKELFYILTGYEETNVDIKYNMFVSITNHRNSEHLFKILTAWLENERHVFTRIAILRIMPKLIEAFSKEIIVKYQSTLIHTLMTHQWAEKKKSVSDLVVPTLISLWLKV